MRSEQFFRGLFFLGLAMAAGYGIYRFVSQKELPTPAERWLGSIPEDPSHETLLYAQAYHTPAGPVCWLFSQSYNRSYDSVWYLLHIVDPESGKEVGSRRLTPSLPAGTSSDQLLQFSQPRFAGGLVWLYHATELKGYVPENGTEKVSARTLSQQFERLKAGIGKVEPYWWGDAFKLTTLDGFEFYFLPGTGELFNEKELEALRYGQNATEQVADTVWLLSDGIRKELYRVTGPTRERFGDAEAEFKSKLDSYLRDSMYFSRNYKKWKVMKVQSGRVFIEGLLVAANIQDPIILHRENITADAALILESVSEKGQGWVSRDTTLHCLFSLVEHQHIVKLPVMNGVAVIQNSQDCIIGIHAESGKLLWTYRPRQLIKQ